MDESKKRVNPKQLERLEEMDRERESRKADYAKIAGSKALDDLMAYLDRQASFEARAAVLEIDNPNRAQALLQRSYAYDKVMVYINDQLR